jgi:hypothetical protein
VRHHHLAFALFVSAQLACSKPTPPETMRGTVGTNALAAASASGTPAVSGLLHFTVDPAGVASISAEPSPWARVPLAKCSNFRGTIEADPEDMRSLRGVVDLDLIETRASVFDDASQNARLTDDAHAWLGLGVDVELEDRERNRWARLSIRDVESANPIKLADAAEELGARSVHLRVRGEFMVHGVSRSCALDLETSWIGPASSPTSFRISRASAIDLSLHEHNITPRDSGGKPLARSIASGSPRVPDHFRVTLDRLLFKRSSG